MPPEDRQDFTVPQGRVYQAMKNRLFFFRLGLDLFFLSALVVSGWSLRMKSWLMNIRDDFFSINALYLAAFGAAAFIVFFPLDFYEGFILEHRFRLSRQSCRDWLKDVMKKSVISFVIFLVVIEAVYFFLSEFARIWWLWASLFWFFICVILARLFPQVILPLFYKYAPLPDGQLRERIFFLLRRYQVPVKDIYVLDFSTKTVKANAMVAGLGRTKRIFLTDTLVSGFSGAEIEAVLAHEVGHYLKRDTLKLVFLHLATALISFYCASFVLGAFVVRYGFGGVSDIAGLPLFLLVLMIVGLILLPLQNGFSRHLETKADLFSLQATGDPEAFISAMKRLGSSNLSDFTPPPWIESLLYDHPALARRIQRAQAHASS